MVELEPLWIAWPHARIRREICVRSGGVDRFVVQLEYNVTAGTDESSEPSWRIIARFDHEATAESGHDIIGEGLHLDIYRDGVRFDRLRGFPRLAPGRAMRYGESYLLEQSDLLLARFERWHGIDGPFQDR